MPGVRRVKRALLVFRCRVEQANEWAVPDRRQAKHALLNLSHGFAVDVGIVSAGWFVLNRGGRADKCHCDAIFPPFS